MSSEETPMPAKVAHWHGAWAREEVLKDPGGSAEAPDGTQVAPFARGLGERRGFGGPRGSVERHQWPPKWPIGTAPRREKRFWRTPGAVARHPSGAKVAHWHGA